VQVKPIRETHRVARKRLWRRCFACQLPILPGDKYTEAAFAEDRLLWVTQEHTFCREEAAEVFDAAEGYGEGLLADYADEASEEWQRWYGSRSALPRLLLQLAGHFRARVLNQQHGEVCK
jgi:hypothetical protein